MFRHSLNIILFLCYSDALCVQINRLSAQRACQNAFFFFEFL